MQLHMQRAEPRIMQGRVAERKIWGRKVEKIVRETSKFPRQPLGGDIIDRECDSHPYTPICLSTRTSPSSITYFIDPNFSISSAHSQTPLTMAPSALEPENKARDADFHRAMHGKSGQGAGGLRALFQKNAEAGALSGQEYFKHFDNQAAKDETPEQREARRNMYASLTREYYVSSNERGQFQSTG